MNLLRGLSFKITAAWMLWLLGCIVIGVLVGAATGLLVALNPATAGGIVAVAIYLLVVFTGVLLGPPWGLKCESKTDSCPRDAQ